MLITIIQNKLGHVHIFKGKLSVGDLDFTYPYNIRRITPEGKLVASDLYLQVDYDILKELGGIESLLTEEQLEDYRNGWPVVIEDPGYF